MPRVNIGDIEKYSTSSGGKYFSLKNDKDTASVRFLLDSIEDLNDYIYAVHDVKIAGNEYGKHVNCLREYNDPVDDCPFCRKHYPITTRIMVPLYDLDSDSVKIWDRPAGFIKKMQSLCSRYKNLVSHTFDVERNGERKDTKTTYEIYETGQDDTTLEDLPEVPEIVGSTANFPVMEKTEEDMEYYIEEREFPPEDEDDAPVRRRSSRDSESEDGKTRRRTSSVERAERRTPASRSRNKEDKF